jgi:hypothetical protein
MVNTTLARGHHAQTWRTARNFLTFHTVAVLLNQNFILLFLTGDIARLDSQRYKNINAKIHGPQTRDDVPACFIATLPAKYNLKV